jgi:hypothetical protein
MMLELADLWEARLQEEGLGNIPDDNIRGYITYGVLLSGIPYRPGDEDAGADKPTPWVSGYNQPAMMVAQKRLERLYLRIPTHYAITLRLSLQGLSQSQIGVKVGRSQTSICYRLQQAHEAIGWVANNLPDLVPSEVEAMVAVTLPKQMTRWEAVWFPMLPKFISTYLREWNQMAAIRAVGFSQGSGTVRIHRLETFSWLPSEILTAIRSVTRSRLTYYHLGSESQ